MTVSTHFIDGKWVAGLGHDVNSVDPAKNTVIWSAKSASSAQVDDAISAARGAFPEWSLRPLESRLAIVKKFGELLAENKVQLAKIIAQETGKPEWETATEAGAMLGKIAISEKSYHERTGTIENAMPVGQA
ncbi:MAG: succinylglutamic semialdehyde dehydrogenase, partial [Granulosicoccus sp.]